MEHATTLSGRALATPALQAAPPRWAVAVVKCCVVGILSLPLATLLWAFLYRPTEQADLGPVAFLVAIGLGALMFGAIGLITSTYPPVPTRHAEAQR